jgi:hypothetical protein
MEMIHGGPDARPHRILSFQTAGKGMDFESVAVMTFQRADEQLHYGMIAKIS